MRTGSLNKLTARAAKAAGNGMHSDGGGLFLRVKGNRRSWVFRFTAEGRKREMGLGSASSIDLAEARGRAAEARQVVSRGENPIDLRSERRSASAPSAPATPLTFRAAMEEFLKGYTQTLTNAKHRRDWWSSLEAYAAPLMQMDCAEIRPSDIHACLASTWLDKMETSRRVRQRIERVLAWADAQEDRDRRNPADMKGKLGHLLPPQSRLKTVKHHAAVGVSDAPTAFATLWAKRDAGMGYRAIVGLILAGLRSGEARHLEWDDIGGDRITIPACRMKARRDHVVPLTAKLRSHLEAQPRWAETPLVFPGTRGQPLSDMTLAMAMRRSGLGDFTVHGWRSTFRDWSGREGWPRELAEHQLAHNVGNAVERAYARDSLVERRREMMCAWEEYLVSEPFGGETWEAVE